ncbi:MAG: transporter [Flavobacteriaceae bacterium]
MIKNLIYAILLSMYSMTLNAQTCCSGGIPLSNNIGLDILGKGILQINLSYDYNNLNTLNIGKDKIDDSARLRTTNSVLLNLSYSITNDFAIEGLLSWVAQKREITQFRNENTDRSSGIGDGVLLAKYNFSEVLGQQSAVRFGLGVKIPIGSTTKTNSQGIVLNADMQPGSGAWDVIYWGQALKNFKFRPSLNFSVRAIYRGTGVNNDYFGSTSYEFGNEFQTFLSFTDEFIVFNKISVPSISFKYRHAKQDKIGGFEIDNTGGEWVFFIPNFTINLSSNFAMSIKAELPIYSYVDGTQLTPTYRITSGVLYKIPLKKKLKFYKNEE